MSEKREREKPRRARAMPTAASTFTDTQVVKIRRVSGLGGQARQQGTPPDASAEGWRGPAQFSSRRMSPTPLTPCSPLHPPRLSPRWPTHGWGRGQGWQGWGRRRTWLLRVGRCGESRRKKSRRLKKKRRKRSREVKGIGPLARPSRFQAGRLHQERGQVGPASSWGWDAGSGVGWSRVWCARVGGERPSHTTETQKQKCSRPRLSKRKTGGHIRAPRAPPAAWSHGSPRPHNDSHRRRHPGPRPYPRARPVARLRRVRGPGSVPPARRRGGRAWVVRPHRNPGAGGAVRAER